MQKIKEKKHILGDKQKEILIFLAENGPHTIYGICRKKYSLNEYHAVHSAVKNLEEKKRLIRKLNSKEYWVTPEGQLTALLYNANIKKVKENALKYCKQAEKEDLSIFYEIAESIGPETANKMFQYILEKGKFELSYLPIDEKDIEKIFKILKQYPKYRKMLEDVGEKLIEKIKEVLDYE
jgi:hypothetical protein